MEVAAKVSTLQNYPVAEFVQWNRQGRLILNPDFQRRSIWTLDAKSYLIDTMLLGFPFPKIYLRTKIDTKTQASIWDVVDGQQRLRAILEFADNRLALNRRSEQFRGMRYSDLLPELQEAFLAYPIGVEQLFNASDSVVLQIFSRLNSYNLPLNPAEKRHAVYQTELKWFVHSLSNDLRDFLTRYQIVSTRTMLRMEDDAFFAELVNIVVSGIGDGGAVALDQLYRAHKADFPAAEQVRQTVVEGVRWMDEELSPLMMNPSLSRSYQIQMIFAAYVHQRFGLPPGRLPDLPPRRGVDRMDRVIERLSLLAQALETEDYEGPHEEFVKASSGATTRFSSRSVRFLAFNAAIASE